ncbi:hypothetical protein WA016_01188 [Myxococcus stipitatus]
MNVHDLNWKGAYRYTRRGMAVFHMPVARPWTWALTHHGMWSLFVADIEPARTGMPERRHPLHPPREVMGHWLAIYATSDYDADGVTWLQRAHGLEAPSSDTLPHGAYVAMARLAEVSTIGNDSRSFGNDPWWAPPKAPFCRGTIAWWLEELMVFEPLPAPPAQRLTLVDPELLPELRERVALARDGIWRPEVYAVPAPPPRQPPPPAQTHVLRRELPADDSPVSPMGDVVQLGLFGDSAPLASRTEAEQPATSSPIEATNRKE